MQKIEEYIALCRVKRGGMSMSELARRAGYTPQNLSNKCARDTFRMSDLERIAEALGADVEIKFIDKESGTPII